MWFFDWSSCWSVLMQKKDISVIWEWGLFRDMPPIYVLRNTFWAKSIVYNLSPTYSHKSRTITDTKNVWHIEIEERLTTVVVQIPSTTEMMFVVITAHQSLISLCIVIHKTSICSVPWIIQNPLIEVYPPGIRQLDGAYNELLFPASMSPGYCHSSHVSGTEL